MSNATAFQGYAEADAILKELPVLLRGVTLERALKAAMSRLTAASKAAAPRDGASVGGIRYTPRRGERAARQRLAKSIGSIIRRYQGATVAVGGPVKRHVGRHAHLVEFGFTHTTGGTVKSGGRTRDARKTVRFDRTVVGPTSKPQVIWRRITERDKDRTGTGKRGAKVPGRSYINAAFEAEQSQVQQEVLKHLTTFANDIHRKYNKASP